MGKVRPIEVVTNKRSWTVINPRPDVNPVAWEKGEKVISIQPIEDDAAAAAAEGNAK